MANFTMVTEFLLLSSPDGWNMSFLYFTVYPLMYVGALVGNLLIITITTADHTLHTPMYFFLRNLSILDMCFISITVPNTCVNYLTGNRVISVAGCASQIFLVIFCAYVEIMFLSIMAWDRYVAICQPLQYPIIMNPQFCVRMTLSSLLSGLMYAGVHTGNTFRLSFCQSNVVHQFFCEVPSLLRLSCFDNTSNMVLLFVSTIIVDGGSFGIIIMSYIHKFSTVLKVPNKAPGKAFSTCIPHILVLSIFLSSSIVNHNLENMANSTMVMEYHLLGSPDSCNMSLLYFTVFLVTYLSTLLGNMLMVTVTSADQNLHTPMYFFLRNLSILDMCFIYNTVPNDFVNSLTGNRVISVAGCAIQIFVVIFCAYVEMFFLTIMAWDYYVAICQSLQYPPYILVVSIFLSSITFVYLRYSANSNTLQDSILSAFYTMVPPFLNPLICSLRDKEVKEAVRRVMGRQLLSEK
ncbi:Olfactory receptor 14C36 [Sciurus carolinensis]|uniref:Olfactory receptor 14C36 n=1 Tax=Sciurus carolinensis TaxID=30640 RepID=A0AA41MHF0_SCICA|nr:Olfactory receptor 14C36 [Sciurus carolinensis]